MVHTWAQQLPWATEDEEALCSNHTSARTKSPQEGVHNGSLTDTSASAFSLNSSNSFGGGTQFYSASMRFSLVLMGYALPVLVPIALAAALAAALVFVRLTRLSSGSKTCLERLT